jgi:hypothetical protein
VIAAIGSTATSSPAAVFASKVKLVELAISAQRTELHRCRSLFLRDVTFLQDELAIKSREVEALHVELHAAKAATVSGGGGGASATPAAVSAVKVESHWQTHTDPGTGRPYYFNTKTQESTWEKPAELTTAGMTACCFHLHS